MGAFLAYTLVFAALCSYANSQLVPAIVTFGDSTVDVGNNDYIHTIFKADHPPYGQDFSNREPTGRFCNGKLATDITGKLKTTLSVHEIMTHLLLARVLVNYLRR